MPRKSNRRRPQGKSDKSVRHKNDATQNRQGGAIGCIPPNVLPSDANNGDASWESDPTPRWKKNAEIVALVTAILLLVVNGFMAWANWKAANAAKEASETAAHQLEISERPWIRFRNSQKYGTPIQISAGKRLDVPGQFINTGKTPALHVRATVFVQIVGPGNHADLPGKNQSIPEPGKPFPKGGYQVRLIPPQFDWSPALYPSQYTQFTVFQVMGPYNGRNIPLAITNSQYQDLRQGKSYVAVWGE